MDGYAKGTIVALITMIVLTSFISLAIGIPNNEFLKFIAQSIVDNAIFCLMFLVIVYVTGISC